ncbi:uncharacterized protein N7515_006783 [Penicillium bovifimosum]|uniref:Uncharacterized protein n=1 Tax=Penicillium bovifimosum TaxID=126998 RepID=A0A9W9L137_9EURO|nr:uncharacterized protein N7515_006783 [Penicillium bovifimosum]KAJ5130744.1 hypothetical protein N7515_006783 [Penicillium bovifimosum]
MPPSTITSRIPEDTNEQWEDDEIHKQYNVPMVAVKAHPRVLMHCEVSRDTASALKIGVSIDKWISTEYFIWEMAAGLADSRINPHWTQFFDEHYKGKWEHIQHLYDGVVDLPERFIHPVPAPPFHVAEVRIQTEPVPRYWRLRANTGRPMIETGFWDLWKYILRCDASVVGPVEVILRAPSRTPDGEDAVDPWNMASFTDQLEGGTRLNVAELGWAHDFAEPAPLEPLRNPGHEESSSSSGSPSSSLAALRTVPHRVRRRLSRSNSKDKFVR